MKLTGKTEEAFRLWLDESYDTFIDLKSNWDDTMNVSKDFEVLPGVLQNALIIEFFDSAGIYIQHFNSDGSKGREFDADVSFNGEMHFIDLGAKTRLEAVNMGIEKANEIYNSK